MTWLLGSILSIIFFSATNAFARYFSPKLPSLIALFLQIVSTFFVLLVALIITKSFIQFPKLDTKPEILAAILAGITWFLGQLILYVVFTKGPPLTIVIPLITGGVAIGGVLTGLLFFNESLTMFRLFGIFLVLVGSIFLVKS